jgi:hypothetical protein
MSDWSKRQSCEELMTRKILRSSAKIKNLQWLFELHRSLMNTLKRKGPRIIIIKIIITTRCSGKN